MNFIKKHSLILSITTAFLALLAGTLFLLDRKIHKQEAVSEDLEQKVKARNDLWNRKPFPSEENINLIRKNTEEIKNAVKDALKILSQGSLSFERITGSRAKADLLEGRRRMADVLSQKNIKFPNKFQFGFDRYDVRPPDDQDTPLIQKQLKIIEELIKLIGDSGFTEVTAIRRVEFEGTQIKTTTPPVLGPLISTPDKFEYVDNSSYIYSMMPFELEVWGDMAALRDFLNVIAHSQYIFLPKIIKIDNEKKEAITGRESTTQSNSKKSSAKTSVTPRSNNVAPASTVTNELPKVDPATLPFVMGDERIKMSIRIEWIEFRK